MQTIFPAAYQSQVASSAWHPKHTKLSVLQGIYRVEMNKIFVLVCWCCALVSIKQAKDTKKDIYAGRCQWVLTSMLLAFTAETGTQYVDGKN